MGKMKELYMLQQQYDNDRLEDERREAGYFEELYLRGLTITDADPGDEQQPAPTPAPKPAKPC